MIFSKLPGVLQKEIIHTVGSNYPSLGQIFMSHSNIIRTPHEASVPKPRGKSKYSGDGKARKLFHKGKPSTQENFRVDSKAPRYKCNFCRTNNHISFLCKKYASLVERLARCKELDLCFLCALVLLIPIPVVSDGRMALLSDNVAAKVIPVLYSQ